MYQSTWADPEQASERAQTGPADQTDSPAPGVTSSASDLTLPAANISFALSAAATSFAPAASDGPAESAVEDTFAPTGPQQNELFDDVPHTEESMRIRSDDDLFNDDFTPASHPVQEHAPQQLPAPVTASNDQRRDLPPRGQGGARRGRGRGRGRPARNNDAGQERDDVPARHGAEPAKTPSESNAPENAPIAPRKETVPAVRGERHATGGVRKPKLSEDELAEKMARISVKNASLAAAHARAEADTASFAKRESQAKVVAAQRQKEERRDRQHMMGEREKNRLRKLKAMEGREWDAEKREDDFAKGGRSDKLGNFAGDQQDYSDGREYLHREPKSRGTGRGGHQTGYSSGQMRHWPSNRDEFPALPPANKPASSAEQTAPITNGRSGDTESWAEQMESTAAS